MPTRIAPAHTRVCAHTCDTHDICACAHPCPECAYRMCRARRVWPLPRAVAEARLIGSGTLSELDEEARAADGVMAGHTETLERMWDALARTEQRLEAHDAELGAQSRDRRMPITPNGHAAEQGDYYTVVLSDVEAANELVDDARGACNSAVGAARGGWANCARATHLVLAANRKRVGAWVAADHCLQPSSGQERQEKRREHGGEPPTTEPPSGRELAPRLARDLLHESAEGSVEGSADPHADPHADSNAAPHPARRFERRSARRFERRS